MKLLFEWDPEKRREIVASMESFDEARTVFADPLLLVAYDPDQSDDEERFLATGESMKRRVLIVVAVETEDDR